MLYVQLSVHGVRRALGVVLPIEVRWYKRFSFTGRQVVCRADMNPLAIDRQLGETVKAVNPLNTPVVVKRPHKRSSTQVTKNQNLNFADSFSIAGAYSGLGARSSACCVSGLYAPS